MSFAAIGTAVVTVALLLLLLFGLVTGRDGTMRSGETRVASDCRATIASRINRFAAAAAVVTSRLEKRLERTKHSSHWLTESKFE